MKNYIKAYIVSFARLVLKLGYIFPVKKHKIIFSSYEGMQYTCNPKYLFEGLFDSLDSSYEYVWVLNNPDFLPEKYRKSVKTAKYLSPTHIYHLLTSGIIISNLGIEPIIPKRASQKFINTWHGGGAYKRVSSDMNMFSKSEKYYINKMRDIRHKGTDYFLSSCERFTEVSIIRKSKNPPKPIRKVQNPLKIGQNHNSKGLLNCKSRNIIKQKSVGNNINPTLFCFNHATL